MKNCKFCFPSIEQRKKQWKCIFLILSLILPFLLVFFLNVKTPLIGDDFSYRYIFNTFQPIQSISDVFHSQVNHYFTWGGRVVVHFLAQALLMIDPLLADLLNSLAFMVLVVLIYFHINTRRQLDVTLFISIFFLLWFFLPFAETVLWITGSANYMWGMLIILTFLLPYRLYQGKSIHKLTVIVRSLLMFIGGLIAGCVSENMSASLLVMAVMFLIYYKRLGWQIPIWLIIGVVGVFIGYVFMIAAPGNMVRAAGTKTDLFLIGYRIFRHTQALLNNVGVLVLGSFILLWFVSRQSELKHIVYRFGIYQVGVFVSVYIMVFSPSFPERAWFGVIVLAIISLGILFVSFNSKEKTYLHYLLLYWASLVLLFNFYDLYKESNRVEKIYMNRFSAIQEYKKEGKKKVIIKGYSTSNKHIIADPSYAGPSMTKYFGIEVEYLKEE